MGTWKVGVVFRYINLLNIHIPGVNQPYSERSQRPSQELLLLLDVVSSLLSHRDFLAPLGNQNGLPTFSLKISSDSFWPPRLCHQQLLRWGCDVNPFSTWQSQIWSNLPWVDAERKKRESRWESLFLYFAVYEHHIGLLPKDVCRANQALFKEVEYVTDLCKITCTMTLVLT